MSGGVLRRIAASVCVMGVCLAGALYYASELNDHYPVAQWLAWHLLPIVGWTLALNVALVVGGHGLYCRLLGKQDGVSTIERLLFSFALGLTAFALLMYAAGSVGAFRPWFAVALPFVLASLGVNDLGELHGKLRDGLARTEETRPWARALTWTATAFGTAMLVLLYLGALTPDALNFDAIWYHVPVAQDYARFGRLVPFYGDNHRAYPHLTSLLHTWALLVPGIKEQAARWVLMLHIEYSMVVWRLVGAAAVAQWFLGGRRVPGLWAVFFLFPSPFIYDQNIAGSADHVIGATAVPIFLALGYLLRRFELRWAVLLGICAGSHILVKYQAIYMVAVTFVLVTARTLWFAARRYLPPLRQRLGSGQGPGWKQLIGVPCVVAGVALLISSPHFIKNAVYYQNPLYPFAAKLFPSKFDDWQPPEPATEHEEADEEDEEDENVGPGLLDDEEAVVADSDDDAEDAHEADDASEAAVVAENQAKPHAVPSEGVAEPEQAAAKPEQAAAKPEQAAAKPEQAAAKPEQAGPAVTGPGAGKLPGKSPLPADKTAQLRPDPERRKSASAKKKAQEAKQDEVRFVFTRRTYTFAPQGKWVVERVAWLHKTLWEWSFETGNRNLTGQLPYMGSLFTLLLPALLFLPNARRLWLGTVATYIAFCVWGLSNANDRYLLTFMSLPIGLTAALMVRVWQLGIIARCGLVPLVALQLLWGLDAPFHYGDKAIKDAIQLVERGYRSKKDDERFPYRGRQRKLTQRFPADAVILGRYYKDLVGFDRTTLNTHRAIQSYINFRKLRNVREFWQICHDRGVTHLLYPDGQRRPHWAQDTILFDALVAESDEVEREGGLVIAKLPKQPPAAKERMLVLVLGVREYQDGLYHVTQLSTDERGSRKSKAKPQKAFAAGDAKQLLEQADAVYMKGNRLRGDASRLLGEKFERVERFGSLNVYLPLSEKALAEKQKRSEQRSKKR